MPFGSSETELVSGAVAVLTPMVSWLPWVSYLIDITGARSSAG